MINVKSSWSLFLDRDGVINEKIENDYVKNFEEFVFCEGSLLAIKLLSNIFTKIILVTNQRGVGKKLMTLEQLEEIHQKMSNEIFKAGGRIDKIYYCVDSLDSSDCRKPNTGMGLIAKKDFPDINFDKSIMVGDSISDMIFAKRLGMKCVYVSSMDNHDLNLEEKIDFNFKFNSLFDFAQKIHLLNF
jgi:D-glycero-D-manno-heptose 1,7-bisphosphate phosphatase